MTESPPVTPNMRLEPKLEFLQSEYVLVQAWKKAHDYIRYHNWYADVLELDLSAARLPEFIKGIQADLVSAETLASESLRLVMAPKRSDWEIHRGQWRPKVSADDRSRLDLLDLNGVYDEGVKTLRDKLRPLGHATIRDQTIGVAMMMCLADLVEQRQGDPRWNYSDCRAKHMSSYGNRLFCDELEDGLRHRWANATTYRKYYQDFREFVKRPKAIADRDFPDGKGFAIVHADLSQFSTAYARTR